MSNSVLKTETPNSRYDRHYRRFRFDNALRQRSNHTDEPARKYSPNLWAKVVSLALLTVPHTFGEYLHLPFRNSFGSNRLRNDFAVLCRIIKLVLINYCLNEVNIVPTMRKHIDVLAAGVISKNSRVYFVCGLARLCQSHCNSRFESGATLSPHQSRCSKSGLSVD